MYLHYILLHHTLETRSAIQLLFDALVDESTSGNDVKKLASLYVAVEDLLTDEQFERLYAFEEFRTFRIKDQTTHTRLCVLLRYHHPRDVIHAITRAVINDGVRSYDLAIAAGMTSEMYVNHALEYGHISPTVVIERALSLPEGAWSFQALHSILMDRNVPLLPRKFLYIRGFIKSDTMNAYAYKWLDGRTKDDVLAALHYDDSRLFEYIAALLDAPGECISICELYTYALARHNVTMATFLAKRYLAGVTTDDTPTHKRARQ